MGQRLALLLLVLCMTVQGLALTVQRAGGQLHRHLALAQPAARALAAAPAHGVDRPGVAEVSAPPSDRQIGGSHRRPTFMHPASHRHHHAGVADHEHEPGDRSVVPVVQGDPGASPVQPAPPLRAPDLDGLLNQAGMASAMGLPEGWRREGALRLPSFVPALLERPPSA